MTVQDLIDELSIYPRDFEVELMVREKPVEPTCLLYIGSHRKIQIIYMPEVKELK